MRFPCGELKVAGLLKTPVAAAGGEPLEAASVPEMEAACEAEVNHDPLHVKGFIRRDDSIYFDDDDKGPEFVCTPMEVLAETRDTDSMNWGLQVQFNDSDANVHRMAIPQADLTQEGAEVC